MYVCVGGFSHCYITCVSICLFHDLTSWSFRFSNYAIICVWWPIGAIVKIEKYNKIVKTKRETVFKMKVKTKRETLFKMKVKTKRETVFKMKLKTKRETLFKMKVKTKRETLFKMKVKTKRETVLK